MLKEKEEAKCVIYGFGKKNTAEEREFIKSCAGCKKRRANKKQEGGKLIVDDSCVQ